MNTRAVLGWALALGVLGIIGYKMLTPAGVTVRTASRPDVRTITIDGSNTMVHLATSWSEAYMKDHPDTKIIVNGQGSGTGIAALIQGTIDICAASRPMKEKERISAGEHGFTPKEYPVALDGIAVIVHPSNQLKSISFEQVRKIYTGVYTDWKQVGIPPAKIDVINRESSSGTYEFFLEHVLNKEDFTPKAKMLSATSAVIQTVSVDTGAMGYVGLGYALEAKGKVKILAVTRDGKATPVLPSETTVVNGSYPIARSLFFYTRGEATGDVKQFIDFCLDKEGQTIVKETGFVQIGK